MALLRLPFSNTSHIILALIDRKNFLVYAENSSSLWQSVFPDTSCALSIDHLAQCQAATDAHGEF